MTLCGCPVIEANAGAAETEEEDINVGKLWRENESRA